MRFSIKFLDETARLCNDHWDCGRYFCYCDGFLWWWHLVQKCPPTRNAFFNRFLKLGMKPFEDTRRGCHKGSSDNVLDSFSNDHRNINLKQVIELYEDWEIFGMIRRSEEAHEVQIRRKSRSKCWMFWEIVDPRNLTSRHPLKYTTSGTSAICNKISALIAPERKHFFN